MSYIKNIVIDLQNLELELKWLTKVCPENTSDIQIVKDKINKIKQN